jgi:hypothetical protein
MVNNYIFSQNQPFDFQSINYRDFIRGEEKVQIIKLDPELIYFFNQKNIKSFSFKYNISKNSYVNSLTDRDDLEELEYLDKQDSIRDYPLNKYTRFDSILVKFHPKTYALKEIQKYHVKNYDLVKWDTITDFSKSSEKSFLKHLGTWQIKNTYQSLANNFTGTFIKYRFIHDTVLFYDYLTLEASENFKGAGRRIIDKLGFKILLFRYVFDSLGWLTYIHPFHTESKQDYLETCRFDYNFLKNEVKINQEVVAYFGQGDDFSLLHTSEGYLKVEKESSKIEKLIDPVGVGGYKLFKTKLVKYSKTSDLQIDFNFLNNCNQFYLNVNHAKVKLGEKEITYKFFPKESNGKIFTIKNITPEFSDKYKLVFKDTFFVRLENKFMIEENDLNVKNAPKTIWLSESKDDKILIFNFSAKIFYNELGYPILFYYKDYRLNRWRKEEYTYDGTFLSSVKYYTSRFGFTVESTPEKAFYKLDEINDFKLSNRIQQISDTKFKILPSKYYKNGLVGEIEVEFWK